MKKAPSLFLGHLFAKQSIWSYKFHANKSSRNSSIRFFVIALFFTIFISANAQTMAPAPAGQPGHNFPSSKFIAKGYTPQAVSSGKAQLIAPLSATQVMRFTIVLFPPHRAEATQLVAAIQDPHSPQYRHFLSFDEWKGQYAPSDANVAAVETWAKGTGLKEIQRFASNHALVFDGTVSTVQKAFQVTINQYSLAGQKYFANDRKPVVPLSVAPLIDNILGLSSFEVIHPALQAHAASLSEDTALPHVPQGEFIVRSSSHLDGQITTPASIRFPGSHPDVLNGWLEPTDIWSSRAYNFNGLAKYSRCCNPAHVTGGPPETTIAIIGQEKPQLSDIALFVNQYPLASVNVSFILINDPFCCDLNAREITLDTEWAIATSNSLNPLNDSAHILVYAAGGPKLSDLLDSWEAAYSDNKARIVSTSFGAAEDTFGGFPNTSISSFTDITNGMLLQGWTVVAAAGDDGAYDNCESPSTLSVHYPASDLNVIAIGGTVLSLGKNTSEGTWSGIGCFASGGNAGGGGGGCSNTFFAPAWQGTIGGCDQRRRAIPDISLNAGANQVLAYLGNWQGIGGTSIGAPEMAGFFAQLNSYLLYLGKICGASHNEPCAPLGNPGAALYAASTPSQNNPYYDISDGVCNGGNPNQPGYCSGPGYDKATGWGSANLLQLAWAINRYRNSPGSQAPTISFSGPPQERWYPTDQTVSFTIQGGTMGIAGYSAQWDVDPGLLPTPTPPRGDPFWDGPAHPLATNGSMDLASAGPNCHTLYVRAWDNDGVETPAATYGQLCFGQIGECQIAYSCPAKVYAPPLYTVSCPTPVDFYSTDAEQSMTFIGGGLTHSDSTIDVPSGIAACASGTTNSCKGFSTYKPPNEWCAPPPTPTPPPPPGQCCKACTAAGGTCRINPKGGCLCF
jgi:subtilase family serine protease